MSRAIDNGGPGTLPDTARGLRSTVALLHGRRGDLADCDRDFQRAVITIYLRTDDYRAMKL